MDITESEFAEMHRYLHVVVHEKLKTLWCDFSEGSNRSGWTTDLVQQSLLNMCRNRSKIEELQSKELMKYGATVAHNAIRDFLRKLRNSKKALDEAKLKVKGKHYGPEVDTRVLLLEMVDEISEEDFLIVSTILSGFSHEDTSNLLGLSLFRVREGLRHTRHLIRKAG